MRSKNVRRVHMGNDEYKKQQNIKIIIELLEKESLEKVLEILTFIRSYLS